MCIVEKKINKITGKHIHTEREFGKAHIQKQDMWACVFLRLPGKAPGMKHRHMRARARALMNICYQALL